MTQSHFVICIKNRKANMPINAECVKTIMFIQIKLQLIIYLTRTLRAPRGVTKVAGANAYAAKFAASPAPTVTRTLGESDE